MMKGLISRLLLESMMLILSLLFWNLFSFPLLQLHDVTDTGTGETADCIANVKIAWVYCNLMYINIHSRIKLLKKSLIFKVSWDTAGSNKLIHKKLLQEDNSSNKSSVIKANFKPQSLDHLGIPILLLRDLRHRRNTNMQSSFPK